MAPWWVFFLYFAVAFSAVMLVTSGPGETPLIEGVVFGLVCAVPMTGILVVSRRRDRAVTGISRPTDWIALIRAMRTGEPPADTLLDEPLLALVQRRRAQMRQSRFSPWLLSAMTVVILSGAVASPHASAVALACFYVVLTVVIWMGYMRASDRLSRLEATLQSRSHQ